MHRTSKAATGARYSADSSFSSRHERSNRCHSAARVDLPDTMVVGDRDVHVPVPVHRYTRRTPEPRARRRPVAIAGFSAAAGNCCHSAARVDLPDTMVLRIRDVHVPVPVQRYTRRFLCSLVHLVSPHRSCAGSFSSFLKAKSHSLTLKTLF